ncbi:hypothetical protein L2E82_12749 [Cichorium intybus]|uniref:Uncharacterized protein n=1 Tax=Cichorium intybus TaxID=13427 RepID=A0ACB9GHY9_CICIN|nr:hypothetical protein L2E82_12749 [Cichorium intybus]
MAGTLFPDEEDEIEVEEDERKGPDGDAVDPEEDEEGEDEYEKDDFIVDDVDEDDQDAEEEDRADSDDERQKKKKGKKRESEKNYVLDEDDFVLLQDNNITGFQCPNGSKKFKRLKKARADAEEGKEDDDIVAEEDEMADFIVDEEGYDEHGEPTRRRKLNKKKSKQASGVSSSAMHGIFGDVDELLRQRKLGLERIGRYDDRGEGKERRLKDEFESTILSNKYKIEKDEYIRVIDIPERMQISEESTGHPPTDEMSIEEEIAESEMEIDDVDSKFSLYFSPGDVGVEEGPFKRPKRKSHYSICSKAGLREVASKFGCSSEEFGLLISLKQMVGSRMKKSEDAKGTPEEVALRFTCAMFENPQAVLRGARHMAAVEISCEPCVRKHVRSIFMDNAVVSTSPTPDGNKSIDSDHEFAGMKWLKDKPLIRFTDAQWLLIQKAEEEKLLKVSVKLPASVHDKLISDAHDCYLSDGVSKPVRLWNQQRKLIIKDAFNGLLLPSMAKEARGLLTSRAKNWLLMEYGRLLWDKVSVAPYQKKEHFVNSDDYEAALRVMACCWGPGKHGSTFVMLDSYGEVLDVLYAVVLGTVNLSCVKLKEDIYEIIFKMVEENPRDLGHDMEGICVVYGDESLPHLYETCRISSEQLQQESGRYLQNPLAMVATLCGPANEILSWKLSPLESFLKDTLNLMRLELIQGFQDWRRPYVEPNEDQEFYMISGETEDTLAKGKIVQATVCRVQPKRAVCILDSGLTVMLSKEDYSDDRRVNDLTERLNEGDIITVKIKSIQKSRCRVFLSCKESDLRNDHSRNYKNMDPYYYEDHENSENEKEKTLKTNKHFKSRMIVHPRFRNITAAEAMEMLSDMEPGESMIRPSSRGPAFLTLTLKIYDGVYAHKDIIEGGKDHKDITSILRLGKTLKIGEDVFEDVDELMDGYVDPLVTHLKRMLAYRKFKNGEKAQVDESLRKEKTENPSRIAYSFDGIVNQICLSTQIGRKLRAKCYFESCNSTWPLIAIEVEFAVNYR